MTMTWRSKLHLIWNNASSLNLRASNNDALKFFFDFVHYLDNKITKFLKLNFTSSC